MILIVGVAGSGKSTQSKMLAERTGWTWLSMGQLLRQSLQGELEQEMLQGKLIDDATTIGILEDVLRKRTTQEEVLLDGFPRSYAQMPWLLQASEDMGTPIRAVIHLSADENVVRQRLLQRGRIDDTPEAIDERFAEYKRDIVPIVDLLRARRIPIIEVNAEQTEQEVHESIVRQLQRAGIAL